VPPRGAAQGPAAGEKGEGLGGHGPRGIEGLAAVAVAGHEAAADAEDLSLVGLLDTPPQEVLERARATKGGGRAALGFETPDDLAEIGEGGSLRHEDGGASGGRRAAGEAPGQWAWRAGRPRSRDRRRTGSPRGTRRSGGPRARARAGRAAPRRCARPARCRRVDCRRDRWWA